MDPRTQERVERWDSRSFSNGYDGLSALAAEDFSGAVSAGETWLFMLNGRVVGVVDGTIDAFEHATGTTYVAPDPALPLLCSMRAIGGETRAKYYTNDTPLEDVDRTLSENSFTGYVELSEGVLSGDYYLVYYGGRRMAAAYIGNAERLLTDEEAFERAADEVGIYQVIDVDLEVTDVPSGDDASGDAGDESDPASTSQESESTGEPDPDVGAPSEADADAAPSTATSISSDTDPEPSADDASSQSPVADSEDAAGTATDRRSIEFDSEADGESNSSADPEPSSRDDAARAGITTTDPQSRSTDADSPGITDGSSPTSNSSTGSIVEEVDEGDSTADSDVAAGDDRTPAGSDRPDPDDLEAAAEELTENGLPWADSELEADADSEPEADPETAAEPNANTASETDPSSPGIESESESEPGSRRTVGADAESGSEPERQSDAVPDAPDEDASRSDGDPLAAIGAEGDDLDERFKQEERWRETKRIPSLDPDNTSESSASKAGNASARRSRRPSNASSASRERRQGHAQRERRSRGSPNAERAGSGSQPRQADAQRSSARDQANGQGQTRARTESTSASTSSSSQSPSSSPSPEDAETLEADMLEREDKIDQLTQRIDALEGERETLRAQKEELERERDRLESANQELTATVERLESRIAELESDLEELRSATDSDAAGSESAATAGRSTRLSPQQALTGTNLFVRYASKSQPTLETAHAGEADAVSVASNLRLEHHTQFDDGDVTVEGRPYEEFLTDTLEYRFVEWLTETLLYEIRDTNHATELADLYDVIPRIDRAELHTGISLEDDETEDVPDLVTFDVVAFDKRGSPLVVANLNDSRDPADREMLIDLEETASAVNANYPDLGAAMVITSSYFDPGALEVTERATGGGFLSRGSKLSYVNLSRKQGYHLCLVESRSGGFHMNVPEL